MFTLKAKLALLIFAAIFMGLSASLMFTADLLFASAKSANAAASNHITEQGGAPLAKVEEAEHGLSQSAVKIDRWGSFITNSMVVSWWDPLESTCRHASLSIL